MNQKRWAISSLALCLTLGLATRAAAATPPHETFQSELRTTILKEISAFEWASDCFVAANGLGAIVTLIVREDHGIEVVATHYIDTACRQPASLITAKRGVIAPVGEHADRFALLDDPEAVFVRHAGFLSYRHDNEIVYLYAKGEQR